MQRLTIIALAVFSGNVHCKGSGPTYRDCRSPSVPNAIAQLWIEKPK